VSGGFSMKTTAAALLVVTSMTAQAAEPETLTLACKGTTTLDLGYEGAKPEPISMGIVINFSAGTVQGFGNPGALDYPVKITGANEVTIAFYGSHDVMGSSIRGGIDRVTGDVDATSMVYDTKTSKIISQDTYALKCRPTQRMF